MKALALVDAPDHVCCRYRIRAFEPALDRAGWSLTTSGSPAACSAGSRSSRRLPRYDAVILQRKLLPGWQLRALRRKARRLVFDFDDAVLYRDSYDPRGPHLAAPGAAVRGDRPRGRRGDRRQRLPRRLRPPRRGRARPGPGHPDLRRHRTATGRPTDPAGARARPRLDRLVEHACRGWKRSGRSGTGSRGRCPGVRLRVICDRFPDFEPMPVVAVPWSEATEARGAGGGGRRGQLGPRRPLEPGQVRPEGPPVPGGGPAGAGQPGRRPPRDDRAGRQRLPARGRPTEWVEAVAALAADPGLRRRMGRAARASVEANYSVAAWAPAFVAAVAGASPARRRRTRGPSRRATGGAGRPRSGRRDDLVVHARRPAPRRGERMFEPPEWHWAQTGDVGWWVRADWQRPLLGADRPPARRVEGPGPADGRQEGAAPGRLPGRPARGVGLRQALPRARLPGKLRQWFRRGKGRNEGKRTRYLDAIGVPTITPIALGEQRKRKFLLENYLITQAIPDAVPLDEFVERRLPALARPAAVAGPPATSPRRSA